jgi:hypothetical protein
VRNAIRNLGNKMPEDLPPEPNIKTLKRQVRTSPNNGLFIATFTKKIALKCVFSCQNESETMNQKNGVFPPRKTDFQSGADDGIRTRDLRFTKPLLYQLSYVGAGWQDYIAGRAGQEDLERSAFVHSLKVARCLVFFARTE